MMYSPEHIAFLRVGYKSMGPKELAADFNKMFGLNKKSSAIRSALRNHKIRSGRPCGLPTGTYRTFTPEQAEFIRVQCKLLSREKLTVAFNESFGTKKHVTQIIAFMKNHSVNSGRTGRFQAGQKPWNTGIKGSIEPNTGSFQKGNVPRNLKPLGHERICSKDGYILIKVAEPNPYTGAPTRYRFKHHVVWKASNGPIPQGYVLAFIDSDKLNCAIENLVLLTRVQGLYLNRNKYAELPLELKPTMLAMAKLFTKTMELGKSA